MRGFGRTDAPEAIEQYTLLHQVGDMIGVLDALGAETAVIAGHDWGALVAWHAALLRPDRVRAVVGFSVPYPQRGDVRPTSAMPQTRDSVFYQLYFQSPGIPEAELEVDLRAYLQGIMIRVSGDFKGDPGTPGEYGMIPRAGGIGLMMARARSRPPPPLPAWLSEADLDVFVAEFSRTGLRGGLNWYRTLIATGKWWPHSSGRV
jgi:pimeloyl-ACP methyl ester carboxylesterase